MKSNARRELAALQQRISADADQLIKLYEDNAQEDGGSGNLNRSICDERSRADEHVSMVTSGSGGQTICFSLNLTPSATLHFWRTP
jgi:hypothetical protein